MRPDVAGKAEQMLRSFRQTQQELTEINSSVQQLPASLTSDDQLLSVTVSVRDGIVDLTIDPRAIQRYDSSALGTTLVVLINAAQAELESLANERYRALLGTEFEPGDLADPLAAAEAIQHLARRDYGH